MSSIDSSIERAIEAQMNELAKMIGAALGLTSKQQEAANQARLAEQRKAEQARLAKQRQEQEEARLEKERLEAFACRRCPAKFPSNTKLHEHLRNHHAKKPKEAALPTPSTPPTSPTLPASVTPFAAPSMPPQMPLTPPSPPSITLPATPPSTPKRTYLTMDDLFAMFTGRPKPIGLLHRPRNPFPPYNWRISKPSTPQTRITSYFLPVTSKKSKDRNKLAPNRQSSSAAGKLIGVGRIGPKRAPAVSSTSSWISRNQRHSAWTFPTYPPSRNTIPIGTRAGKPWDNYGTTRASSFSKKYGQVVTI